MPDTAKNPAEKAAEETRRAIQACIDTERSFLVEAGAGAGKTYSLIEALRYVIAERGRELLRRNQRVACITYTNVAVEEINARTDRHPVIQSSTIHAFCWSMIRAFQPYLRGQLADLKDWEEKLQEAGGNIGTRMISYDEFGHRAIDESHAALHHNDVLALTVRLLGQPKFRTILTSRYPILFIDEYQDTDTGIADALKTHLLDMGDGPLIGFFGDHWQKIYGNGCGKIEHPNLQQIRKKANFRSVPAIVECLNRLRPDLPQQVRDPEAKGAVSVFHTNEVRGERLTGQHWSGDLPADIAGNLVDALVERLSSEGWDFSAAKTRILMLTHRALAAKQGYGTLATVFPHNEAFIKKEDPHIAFFVDKMEPACVAYKNGHFGEMFAAIGQRTPAIQSPADKAAWARDMNTLLTLRETGTIGAVLDHLKRTQRPRLPDAVEERERALAQHLQDGAQEEPSSVTRTKRLRDVQYKEVIQLAAFVDDQTPFSTKHGVKGAEFENVLVVFGRGWSLYNFGQFLEWGEAPPPAKRSAWERNRNLFYVTCSRPKRRLAILFTQQLSQKAIATLGRWFGTTCIHSFRIGSLTR